MNAVQPLLIGPTLDQAIAEAHQIIEDAKAMYPGAPVIALFSGGNDSTTLLHLCRDRIDLALHINTGIGVEETREFVRDTAATFRVRLDERRTDPAWFRDTVVERGFPGPQAHRYMYINLKERRLREAKREYAPSRRDKVILLAGVRASESQRRMGYAGSPVQVQGSFVWANPIIGWNNWTLHRYGATHAIPVNEVSAFLHKSGECQCGAYAKRGEMDELATWYPATADYIRSIEREASAAGHRARAQWGWGAYRKRIRGIPPPGPMCRSCHLFDDEAVPA